jgi:hypothetical protein
MCADLDRSSKDESRRGLDVCEVEGTGTVGVADGWLTRTILGLFDGASGMSNARLTTSSWRLQPRRLSPLMAVLKIRFTMDFPSVLSMLRKFKVSWASRAICLNSSI